MSYKFEAEGILLCGSTPINGDLVNEKDRALLKKVASNCRDNNIDIWDMNKDDIEAFAQLIKKISPPGDYLIEN